MSESYPVGFDMGQLMKYNAYLVELNQQLEDKLAMARDGCPEYVRQVRSAAIVAAHTIDDSLARIGNAVHDLRQALRD